jgi:hypothetical protein
VSCSLKGWDTPTVPALQAGKSTDLELRALPWAEGSRPFGLKTETNRRAAKARPISLKTLIRLLMLVLLPLAGGCGSSRPQADIDRGRQAVTAALDNWKANEQPAKLKALPDPVEFSDELRNTHTLTGYTLGAVDATDPEVIRYTVTLKLKDRKGKVADREVVYAVALRTPVAVARDPYY